jgi:hypothetical protein
MKAPLRRIVADLDGGRVKLECGHQLGPSAEHHRRRRCQACAVEKRRKLSAALASRYNLTPDARRRATPVFISQTGADVAARQSSAANALSRGER